MLNFFRFLIPTYHDQQIRKRLEALDILRASAIIFVFMWHYPQARFGFIGGLGWSGVDLFFVLSGYLIGNQIFSALIKQHFSLKNFFYRRLLRTLPNYWLVLALYFAIPGFREWHEPMSAPFWQFITFTQNFGLHVGGAFSNAWSLCVEEQFYLILPLLLLWAFHKKTPVHRIWIGILLIILLETILRAGMWLHYIKAVDPEQRFPTYDTYIYYPTYTRLYALLFGVAIALIKNHHSGVWKNITSKGNWFFVMGALGLVIAFYVYRDPILTTNFYPTVFAYPLLNLSFAFLVIAALSPKAYFYHLHIPGATIIASWSYAMYLVQKPMISLSNDALAHFDIARSSLIAVVTAIFFTLLASWLLYTFIETPFLKLRDRKKFFV